jgi:hypothetical protein
MKSFRDLREKTLTPAEKKKREEIAKAMERENPGMDMKKKMAIATAQAKKVAEGYRVHAVSKDGEKMKSGLHPTKKAASDMHYKMSKSGMYKKIEVVKETAELDEVLDTPKAMDSYRNKAKYSKDRAANSAAAKMLRDKDGFKSTDTSDELRTMDKRAKGLKMADKAAARKTRAMLMKKEEVELDEGIENMPHGRLKWHMNTGVPHGSYTKAELKKERDRRLSRVDTHAAYKKAKPSMNEAKEDDMPASPDEASMAMKQLEFIEYAAEEMMDHIKSGKAFPEWFQNKLSKAHGEIEGLHSAMGEHGGDDDEDMKEATELDEISLSHLSNAIAKSTGTKNIKTAMKPGEVKKGLDDLKKRLGTLGKEPQKEAAELDELSKKTLGSYVKKASRDVANRSADNARDVAKNGAKPGLNKKTMKNWRREIGIDMAIDKMTKEAVVSADKKPEKYVKPDGTVGIRMARTDKKVVDKDA